MAAKYSRLPSDDIEANDTVAFDFSSYNTYSSGKYSSQKYKSIFKYGDESLRMNANDSDITVSIVKQSFASRLCAIIITVVCALLCVVTFPISAFFVIKIVSDPERLVVFRLGRLQGVKGPGVNFVIPCIDSVKKVDVRIKAFNVPPLQVLTSDAGIIELGADVYYKVTDVIRSVTAVQDLNNSLRALVRNAMMASLTKHDLQDIENKKDYIIEKLQKNCNTTANAWGVDLQKIQMSPIKVLQVGKESGALQGVGGQEGLTQVFQQLAQAFMSPGGAQGAGGGSTKPPPQQTAIDMPDASGAAVASEDINLESQVTPAGLIEMVRGVLCETLVRNVDAVYQFELSGGNGGVFYMDLKHGNGRAGEGPDPRRSPDVTLELSVRDMQSMFCGKLKPLSAYMSGRLKVSGDLSAAMRLEEVMDRVISKNTSSSVAGYTVVNI